MTPRSFWSILIKILGIYIILESIISVPLFIINAYSFYKQSYWPGNNSNAALVEIALFIIIIIVYGFIVWYCLFKTDWIIDKLKLDQAFEDTRFEFNIHRSTILKIAIMVIGGLLLIDSFPMLCRNIFSYYQSDNRFITFKQNPSSGYVIMYFFKTMIGYFMLTCSRMIVNYIELKRKDRVADRSEDRLT